MIDSRSAGQATLRAAETASCALRADGPRRDLKLPGETGAPWGHGCTASVSLNQVREVGIQIDIHAFDPRTMLPTPNQ